MTLAICPNRRFPGQAPDAAPTAPRARGTGRSDNTFRASRASASWHRRNMRRGREAPAPRPGSAEALPWPSSTDLPPSSAKRSRASRSIASTSRRYCAPSCGVERGKGCDILVALHGELEAAAIGQKHAGRMRRMAEFEPVRAKFLAECAEGRPVMKSTKVVAITSWMKPGAIISSVRMQPPISALRSSTTTLRPLAPASPRRPAR